jgi:hypothetical protein
MSCGSIISASLKAVTRCQYDDIYSQCLITDAYACSRHLDPDFFSLEDSTQVHAYWKTIDSKALRHFSHSLQFSYPQFRNMLPMETTCAWTCPEKCSDYNMYACFLNLTASIGVDISSTAHDYLDTIGSTFLGPCFEHCSAHPIWVRVSDGHVRLTPPPSAPCNVSFAWGTHGERARTKARRRRQQMRRQSTRTRQR